MIRIKIDVKGCTLSLVQPKITSGCFGSVYADFSFSGEWQGLAKTAAFRTDECSFIMPIFDNSCLVPAEVLERCGEVQLGVFGSDGKRAMSSNYESFVVTSGTQNAGEDSENYTPSLYEQFSAKFERFQNVSASAASGDEAKALATLSEDGLAFHFELPKGDKGDKGDKGERGEQCSKAYIANAIREEMWVDINSQGEVNTLWGGTSSTFNFVDTCIQDPMYYKVYYTDFVDETECSAFGIPMACESVKNETTGQWDLRLWCFDRSHNLIECVYDYAAAGDRFKVTITPQKKASDSSFGVAKAGEYITSNEGVLSVDKTALLGDVETALDGIIAIQNSLIGGDNE